MISQSCVGCGSFGSARAAQASSLDDLGGNLATFGSDGELKTRVYFE